MLMYRGAVYREALNTSRISKRDKQEFLRLFVLGYAGGCMRCDAPPIGKDATDYAYAEAIQMFYSAIQRDFKEGTFPELMEALEQLDLSAAKCSRHSFDEWLRRQHLEYEHGLINYLGKRFNKAHEAACMQEGKRVGEQMLRRVEAALQKADGKNCYRMMVLEGDHHPNKLKSVGVYWSLDPSKVGVYGLYAPFARPTYWRFRARVDAKAVNIKETLKANMNYYQGIDEKEVTMKAGTKIWVYGAQRIYGYKGVVRSKQGLEYGPYELGEKVKINRFMEC